MKISLSGAGEPHGGELHAGAKQKDRILERERISIELVTSGRKSKSPREGST